MTVVDRAPTRALACPSPRRRAPGVAVSRRERALRRAVVASWRAYAASTGARRRARRAHAPRKRSSDDRHRSSVIGHRSSLVARLMMWLGMGTITPSQRPIVIRHHVTHTHKDHDDDGQRRKNLSALGRRHSAARRRRRRRRRRRGAITRAAIETLGIEVRVDVSSRRAVRRHWDARMTMAMEKATKSG